MICAGGQASPFPKRVLKLRAGAADENRAGPIAGRDASRQGARGDEVVATPHAEGQPRSLHLIICWALAAVWLALFILSMLGSRTDLTTGLGQFQGLALALFVVAHGTLAYGWRGFGVYAVVTFAVALLFEATSIRTGFPFGFYIHHLGPGLKLFGIPWVVPLSYVVTGWLAWSLARLVVRDQPAQTGGADRFTTPLVATFILAGYDLCFDSIGSTALGLWTWRDPSGLFGVPLSNFLGWLLTGWAAYQIFAFCEPRLAPGRATNRLAFWLPPCLLWLALGLQYPVMYAAATDAIVRVDGRSFVTADIYETALIVSLFTHVFVGLLATIRALRLQRRPAEA